MVVCRYYLEGKCRFGDKCRNEHPRGGAQRSLFSTGGDAWGGGGGGNQRVTFDLGSPGTQGSSSGGNPYKWSAGQTGQVVSTQDLVNNLSKEVDQWEKSKMWPFSCLSADKDLESLPEFYDISVEELRLDAYEAIKSGNTQSFIQKVQSLTSEFQAKRNQLKHMNHDLKQKLVVCVDEARKKKNSGASMSSSSTFGSTQQSSQGLFGQSTAAASNPFGRSSNPMQTSGTTTQTTLFGKPGTGSSTFGFGSSSGTSSGGSSSVFGSSTLFGKPQSSTGSVFGGQSSTTFGGQSSSTFGGQSSATFGQPQTQNSGPFGQPQNSAASSNPFLSASSSGNQMNTSSVFGNQSGPNPTGSLFGGSANPNTQPQTGSILGQPGQVPASQGLFGKPAATGGPFSGSQSSSATAVPGLFSQPAGGQPSLFGKPVAAPTASAPSVPGQSVFGNSSFTSAAPASSQVLSSTPSAQTSANPGRYTPLEDLTDMEKAEFQASSFTLGRIPIRPPPREWISTWNTTTGQTV